MTNPKNEDEIMKDLLASFPVIPEEVLNVPLEVLINDLKANTSLRLVLLLAKASGNPKAEAEMMMSILKSHPIFPQVVLATEAIRRGKVIAELEGQVATLLAEKGEVDFL